MKKQKNDEHLEKYRKLIEEKRANGYIIVFTDGSAHRNGFPNCTTGFGYKIIFPNGKEYKDGGPVPLFAQSISTAEIYAITCALGRFETSVYNTEKIALFSDSKFCINYCMNKKWVSKFPEKPYYGSWVVLNKLIQKFTNLESYWIPRTLNHEADKLAEVN